MCPVKGGATEQTIFNTIRYAVARGATVDEAIAQVESVLHCQLPEHIKIMIRQEC